MGKCVLDSRIQFMEIKPRFICLDLTVFRFFVVKRKKNYALKKPKNSQGKKVKKIKTKKDLDKNTGIKTPGAEILLF